MQDVIWLAGLAVLFITVYGLLTVYETQSKRGA